MTLCPATFCPLFAVEGSPWTGDKAARCEGAGCAWWRGRHCGGGDAAREQLAQAVEGRHVLQLGPVKGDALRHDRPRTFDCPHARKCQWQADARPGLCPPREALRLGKDPRLVAY